MKKAIQYGAGNIGRGFIGKILSDAGYFVYFADINVEIISKLKQDKQYIVQVQGSNSVQETIKNIDGVFSNTPEMISLINEVEIITTAVGPNILKHIAPVIAEGIKLRYSSSNKNTLNIIACENSVNATTQLKNEIFNLLSQEEIKFADEFIGFPNSAVDRIVPPFKSEVITTVAVEEFSEWIVERGLFKGKIPSIKGMDVVDNLQPFIERKLFTLNTGHVFCAYYGFVKGYSTIKQSIDDVEIKTIVKHAMIESGQVLIKKYGFDPEKHNQYIEKIISRFENPYIHDEVSRVAREPIRKLGKNDRLVKPMMECQSNGFENSALIFAIACALSYKDQNDKQSVEMNNLIEALGLQGAIIQITEILDVNILQKIIDIYNKLN